MVLKGPKKITYNFVIYFLLQQFIVQTERRLHGHRVKVTRRAAHLPKYGLGRRSGTDKPKHFGKTCIILEEL
ncbi:hypothetical protein AGDE_16829 [Angomonas deanei]|uniref:Uncharacterized protein n=1 Tax=Angomonas deanei TaxID=59799 RepID=A0A7G2CU87_9TRYP|nr:hypothetical protein AGDE_16829 [Angomonas deanei]CAD2222033.1 hypothetical protein, conserved [Angomonas deanei]|eukprot:EPY16105.1 hypothetical protein AGDE_16829 [Angomonas deanei]